MTTADFMLAKRTNGTHHFGDISVASCTNTTIVRIDGNTKCIAEIKADSIKVTIPDACIPMDVTEILNVVLKALEFPARLRSTLGHKVKFVTSDYVTVDGVLFDPDAKSFIPSNCFVLARHEFAVSEYQFNNERMESISRD
jgi:hypothetical protein